MSWNLNPLHWKTCPEFTVQTELNAGHTPWFLCHEPSRNLCWTSSKFVQVILYGSDSPYTSIFVLSYYCTDLEIWAVVCLDFCASSKSVQTLPWFLCSHFSISVHKNSSRNLCLGLGKRALQIFSWSLQILSPGSKSLQTLICLFPLSPKTSFEEMITMNELLPCPSPFCSW